MDLKNLKYELQRFFYLNLRKGCSRRLCDCELEIRDSPHTKCWSRQLAWQLGFTRWMVGCYRRILRQTTAPFTLIP